MRLGVSLATFHDVDDVREGARNVIERAAAARDAGLDVLSIGDQHASPRPYYQNTPMLGRLLAEWDDRPAGCLFLAPLWHATLMAEQIGTLAAIHTGPFIVQLGLGGGRRRFASMGADVRRRPSLLLETVRFVRALLDGDAASSELLGLGETRISPTPPEPVDWWIGASADTAIDRAARLGGGWYANADVTPDSAQAQLRRYLDACERESHEPSVLAVRKDVYVGASSAEAAEVGDRIMQAGYRGWLPA